MRELWGWIHLEAIEVLVHHTSVVVVAVAMFALVGFVVQRLMHEGPVKRGVLWMEEFLLFCLFLYFAYELFLALWTLHQRTYGGSSSVSVG